MERVSSLGQIGESMRVSTMMTRSKVMVFSLGLMEDNMMASGLMVSKKALESTTTQRVN